MRSTKLPLLPAGLVPSWLQRARTSGRSEKLRDPSAFSHSLTKAPTPPPALKKLRLGKPCSEDCNTPAPTCTYGANVALRFQIRSTSRLSWLSVVSWLSNLSRRLARLKYNSVAQLPVNW